MTERDGNLGFKMSGCVTIGLTGDVMIGRLVNTFLDAAPVESIWGDLLPELLKTDFTLINLEAALTTCDRMVPKVFNFKADPQKVAALTKARIDVVNLANNHVLDYSEEGLIETLETLDGAKILHVGAGKNREEARKPVILSRKGVRVGIVGYTDNEPSWKAREAKPGVHYIEVGDLKTVLEDIRPLRDQVDVLIVTMHWGPNMQERPSSDFIDFAHALIDNGVDIFHGHSAHIFQGYEEYHGGLVLYDTGDFVDDYYVDPLLRNDRSFLFLVQASKDGYQKLDLIPVIIKDFCVHLAKGKEADAIHARMRYLTAMAAAPTPPH